MRSLKSKYKLIAISAIALLASYSCSDFLNVTPKGKTDTPTTFSDMRGMRSAVVGTYYKMFKLYTSYFYAYGDLADNVVNLSTQTGGSAATNIFNYVSNPEPGGYWGTIYENLVDINNIIEYQPALVAEFPANKAELDIIKGEALFLRALSHFDLCKLYGQPYNYTADASHPGVPIVLRAPNYDEKPARNSVKEVYDQILIDLHDAESLLKGKTSRGGKYYVNEQAVYGLLSRVYLYKEDWDNAIKYAGLAIDNTPLAKGNDYTSMYSNLKNNEVEVLFRLDGASNGESTLMTLYNQNTILGENEGIVVNAAPAAPSKTYLDLLAYDTEDIRFSELIRTDTDKDGIVYRATAKFDVKDNDATFTHINPIVLRSSEMYLNRAEAYWNKNMLPEAAADVKAIIARAHNKNVSEITVTETDRNELRTIIENERTKELAFEGHKLFDTTRWKKAMQRDDETTSSIKLLTYPNDLFLQPIPRRELEVNPNMVKNPTVNN